MKPSSRCHIIRLSAALGMWCVVASASAQLIINQAQTPTTLVQNNLLGSGIFVTNVTYNGVSGNIPVAPSANVIGEIARFNGVNTVLGMNGVVLCTGKADYMLHGPNDRLMPELGGLGGTGFFSSPDIDLGHLSGNPLWQFTNGSNIGNKSILEFDFIPSSDMISMRYVFSSEEYERWVCSQYNDVFGFFISGPGIPTNINGPFSNNAMNIAFIPGSMSMVSVNSVNSGLMNGSNANGPDVQNPFQYCFAADPNWQNNSSYYRYNGGQWTSIYANSSPQFEAPYNTDPYYIQHNGLTVTLTASAAVQCGQLYHIKLAIGNVADNRYGSAVWLEQGSFTSNDRFKLTVDAGPNVEYNPTDTTFIENNCDSVYLRFHRLGGFYLDEWLHISTGGTASNGVDYLPALIDSIHFNQLDSFAIVPIKVPVDADGPENLIINLITCNGSHIQTYTFPIDQRPPLAVQLADTLLNCPATITLTPVVTGGGGNPAQYTYLWNTGETTPGITHFVDHTTQFWVTVQDCWSLPATDSAWVTVPPYVPMQLTLTPDTAIPCLGNADLTVHAQFGSGGYTYQWRLNNQVVGADSILNVPAHDPPVYYTATVTDLCGVQVSDSVRVSQAPPPPLVLTLTPDTAIPCLGHADLIASTTGGGGTLQYTWTNGGGATVGTTPSINVPAAAHEVYTVQVADQCGQLVQGQVNVTTGPTPPLHIVAQGDTVMCAGMPVVLSVLSVSGGGGAYSYAWNPIGTGPSNGQSLTVHVDNDMSFTVTVTDQCGNSADTTLMAVVSDYPPLEIEVPNDTTVCPGQVVPLWVAVSGGAGNFQVSWPGVGSGPQLNWTADHNGRNITVEVTDACGTTATASVDVSTFPASASIDAEELAEGTWRFKGDVVPQFGNTVAWDFGDGSTASGVLNVTHTYPDYNAYWVVLQIITPDGCVAVDSIRTRPPAATIYFPNSFTPDADGINDTFGGEGLLIYTYELWVFNRWGQVVFESKDMANRWNGRTSDGEEVPQGIYQYKYIIEGLSMPKRQGFGHVTLLR